MTHPDKVLRRYKLGLGILMIGVVLMAGVYYATSAGERADSRTVRRLEKASQTADNYNSANNQLAAKGSDLKLPDAVEYKKVGEMSYVLCADFKTEREGPDDRGGLLNSEGKVELESLRRKDPDTNYVGIGTYFSRYGATYKEGRNCFYMYTSSYIQPELRYDDLPNVQEQ